MIPTNENKLYGKNRRFVGDRTTQGRANVDAKDTKYAKENTEDMGVHSSVSELLPIRQLL